jgi:hypothetical protein
LRFSLHAKPEKTAGVGQRKLKTPVTLAVK